MIMKGQPRDEKTEQKRDEKKGNENKANSFATKKDRIFMYTLKLFIAAKLTCHGHDLKLIKN